jgi:hypothetical protein
MFKSLAKGLISTAKEEATKTLKDEVAPFVMQQAVIQSKLFLFKQMSGLLASLKVHLIELKLKTKISPLKEDDMAYQQGIKMLKEFSQSVLSTIEEIESY